MPKALDLVGMRFGNLVALKRASNRGKKTYWICQCDCGNKKEVQTCHLTDGSIRSCGCMSSFLGNGISEINECLICGNEFISNNHMRRYCYDCIPTGLNPTDRIRRKQRVVKHALIQYKGGQCEKCGYEKCDAALHFHHKDPAEKEFNISTTNLNPELLTMDILYKEVDKCTLLCANCHAEEHYK